MKGELGGDPDQVTLRGDIEQAGDEAGLASDVASVDVPNLPFPDHRHRFETSQCSSSRPEAAEAEPGSDQSLDTPVILLKDVVQVFALAQTRAAPQLAFFFHLGGGSRERGVLVDRDGARVHRVRLRQSLAEEPLRRRRIPPRRRQKVDRLPLGCPPLDTDTSSAP